MREAKAKDLLYQILAALPDDEGHAIFQRDLARLLRVSPYTIKKAIRYGRQQGYKIISGRYGYFLTENEEILRRFLHTMTKQATTRFGSTTKLRKAAKYEGIAGQMAFDDLIGTGAGDTCKKTENT